MRGLAHRFAARRAAIAIAGLALFAGLAAACQAASEKRTFKTRNPALYAQAAKVPARAKVSLGIDVLSATNFAALQGRRVGLLTNPAGVNGDGRQTVDVLHRARNVNLVALFGPEHGIYGNERAEKPVLDRIDPRTKLPVYSLYGKYRKPTPEMLSKIDTLVIDLQDVGSRSYTYVSCMLLAMEACFESGKEVMVLDRPNPLGGLKVDGPMLDMKFKSYVGMFPAPYVHGLTIGEIALMAKGTPGWLQIPEKARRAGRLRVIRMTGWRRSMQWPETGLKWVPTSPAIPTYAAAVGYSMTGLGCQLGGFQHGYGSEYPFRFLTYKGRGAVEIARRLKAKQIAGLDFRPAKNAAGREGVYVMITDWEKLRPTELSFHLMALACEFSGSNPFASAAAGPALLFNKHVGSEAWWAEISKRGRGANVGGFMARWELEAGRFREKSRNFWLYK